MLEDELAGLLAEHGDRASDPAARAEYQRRIARLAQGEPARAAEAWQRLLDFLPDDREALAGLVETLRGGADAEPFAQAIRRALAVEESAERRAVLLADLAAAQDERLGDPQGAIQALKQLLEVSPGDRDALARLDRLCVRSERWVDLADVLAREIDAAAAEGDEASVGVYRYRLAELKETRLLDREGALALYEEVLAGAPGPPRGGGAPRGAPPAGRRRTPARRSALEHAYASQGDAQRQAAVLELRAGERPGSARAQGALRAARRAAREEARGAGARLPRAVQGVPRGPGGPGPARAPRRARRGERPRGGARRHLRGRDRPAPARRHRRGGAPARRPLRAAARRSRPRGRLPAPGRGARPGRRARRRSPPSSRSTRASRRGRSSPTSSWPAPPRRTGRSACSSSSGSVSSRRSGSPRPTAPPTPTSRRWRPTRATSPRCAPSRRSTRTPGGARTSSRSSARSAPRRPIPPARSASSPRWRRSPPTSTASTRRWPSGRTSCRRGRATRTRSPPWRSSTSGSSAGRTSRSTSASACRRRWIAARSPGSTTSSARSSAPASATSRRPSPPTRRCSTPTPATAAPSRRCATSTRRRARRSRSPASTAGSSRCRRTPPGVKRVRLELAEVLLRAGNKREAVEQGKLAFDIEPHDADDLVRIEEVFRHAGAAQDGVRAAEARAALLAERGPAEAVPGLARGGGALEGAEAAGRGGRRARQGARARPAEPHRVRGAAPAPRRGPATGAPSRGRATSSRRSSRTPRRSSRSSRRSRASTRRSSARRRWRSSPGAAPSPRRPATPRRSPRSSGSRVETEAFDELAGVLEQVAEEARGMVRAKLLLRLGKVRDEHLDDADGAEARLPPGARGRPGEPGGARGAHPASSSGAGASATSSSPSSRSSRPPPGSRRRRRRSSRWPRSTTAR